MLQVKESQRANDSTASQIEYSRQRDSAKDADDLAKNQDNQKLIYAQIYSLQFSDSVSSESFKLARDAYNESVKQNNLKFDIDNQALQNQIEMLKTQQRNFSNQNESIIEILFDSIRITEDKKNIKSNLRIFNHRSNPAKITFSNSNMCFNINTQQCENEIIMDISDQLLNRYVSFGKELNYYFITEFNDSERAIEEMESGTPFYLSGTIKYRDLTNDTNKIYVYKIKVKFDGNGKSTYQYEYLVNNNFYDKEVKDSPNLSAPQLKKKNQ